MIRGCRRTVQATRPPGGPDRPRLDDAGVTLIEVMISMSLMAVVMTLVGSGVVLSYQIGNRTDALANVQASLHTTFSRLDAQVRYADGVSIPGAVGTNQYVEFISTAAGGTWVCTQLRAAPSTGLIQTRTLKQGGAVGTWSTLASQVVTPVSFARSGASVSGATHQQLTVTLSVKAGKGTTAESASAAMTFTALNSTVDTASDTSCSSMGRP
jgi:prepilin-type N-terminal cleavage/methylation domain-containing protein